MSGEDYIKIKRRETLKVKVGNLYIGGGAPIVIQSMNNTSTKDVESTLQQIYQLYEAGCELTRVSVPDKESAEALKIITKKSPIGIVADIHFDYRLAILAIKNGVVKLRINPGNIGGIDKVKEVVKAAKDYGVPIRIGVNAGSLEKHLLEKYGSPTPEAMVESALSHIKILEDLDFKDIIVSLKSSDVLRTIEAYKLLAQKCNYPFHIGITEAGTLFSGTVYSSVGLGILLYLGLGDTIRVSLTADPVEEIKVAKLLLKSLNLKNNIPRVISCPTCARTEIDILKMANEVEKEIMKIDKDISVAVMGCVVNGPGEAKEADYGIAGGKNVGIIFKKGKILGKYKENELVPSLLKIIKEDLEK